MKSRYAAYATNNAKYIINTTHTNNPEYTSNTKEWLESIIYFCNNTEFISLDILEFIDGESEAFVSFKAIMSGGEMIEKSRFLKEQGSWLYERGEVEVSH